MTIVTMVWGSLSLDNFGFMKTSESLTNTELSKFHDTPKKLVVVPNMPVDSEDYYRTVDKHKGQQIHRFCLLEYAFTLGWGCSASE